MPRPLGLTAWPGASGGVDKDLQPVGLSVPQAQLGLGLPWLCYKAGPSPDLCFVLSVKELSPASPI